MPNPLISIIVPIYKVEPYLRRCLDSIVNQTYTNLEIILVDDGSPDGCPQICDEYAAKDKRIVVIHKENGGLSDARNAGLDICKGEYISFVDSDDWVEKEYIDFLLKNSQQYDADILIVNHDLAEAGTIIASEPFEEFFVSGSDAFKKIISSQTIHLGVSWAKLYKRSLFSKIRFPKGKIHEDDYTSYKLIYGANYVCAINRVLYHYYQRADSITSCDNSYDHTLVEKEQLGFLLEKKEFELAELLVIRLGWHWLNQYIHDNDNKESLTKAKCWENTIKKIPTRNFFKRLKLLLSLKSPRLYALYARLHSHK